MQSVSTAVPANFVFHIYLKKQNPFYLFLLVLKYLTLPLFHTELPQSLIHSLIISPRQSSILTQENPLFSCSQYALVLHIVFKNALLQYYETISHQLILTKPQATNISATKDTSKIHGLNLP